MKVGDIVVSKVNKFYEGTYTVEKVNKTTVWVRPNDDKEVLYKGIRYYILEVIHSGGQE